MELLSYVRKIWLSKHSKGTWETMEGEKIYVEELTDIHLMRIPHFLYKRAPRDRKSTMHLWIPWIILQEIEERGMYVDYKDQCAVKHKEEPKPVKNASKFNSAAKRKFNKIFFK